MRRKVWEFAIIFSVFLVPLASRGQSAADARDVAKLAEDVRAWNSRLRGNASGRAAAVPLREAAEARRRAMIELMRAAPLEAVHLALSPSERQALVAQDPALAGMIESHGRWEGDVEVVVFDDFEGQISLTRHYLTAGPIRLEIHAAGGPLPDQCGWEAEFEGFALDGVAAGFVTKSERAVGAGDCSNLGEQKTLGIGVSFPGMDLRLSTAEIEQILFASSPPSMDNFLRATTRGQAWLTGDVTTVRLDKVYTCEDYSELADAVLTELMRTTNLTAYRRLILFFPWDSGNCNWAGRGNLNCIRRLMLPNHWFSISWIRAPSPVPGAIYRTVHHELGHNFGLHHSNSRKYASSALGGPGQLGEWEEYGDPHTVMGRGRAHYTARQSIHAGWMTAPHLVEADSEGAFVIEPIASANEGRKAIRIRRITGRDDWVWVEYHRPDGPYYSQWPAGVARGALVYIEDTNNKDRSSTLGGYVDLLDMTPGSRVRDFEDAVLAEGQEWRDAYSGLNIRVDQAGEQLSVTVRRETPCATVEPAARTHGPGEEAGELTVSASPSCHWEVIRSDPWLELTGPASGTGNGIVTYRVQANEGMRPRRAFLAVGRNAIAIDQLPVNLPPHVVSVSPTEGSGASLDLNIWTLDPNGPQEITAIRIRLAGQETNASACLIEFDVERGEVRLASESGTGWVGSAPGSNLALENTLCRVTSAVVTLPRTGPGGGELTVQLRLGLRFHARFSGMKVISVAAVDRWGAESGWQEAGQWQVVDAPVSAYVSPRESSGPAVRLSFEWNLMPGGTPIQNAWIMIGEQQDWEQSCVLYYEAQPDRISVYLGGQQWAPMAALVSSTTLASGKCRLLRPGVFRNESSGAFWITANLAFPESFQGVKRIWMHAISASGGQYPWTETGRITITGPNAAPQVSAITHEPQSGPGSTLTVGVEDANGAVDVEAVEIIISERREPFDACVIQITPHSQSISLRNDAGTTSLGSSTPSAPRVLENAQCRIDGSRSIVTLTGNSLQVRLTLDLKPVLAGVQQVFVRARDYAGEQTPWHRAGPWNVPVNPGSRPPEITLNGSITSQGHFVSVPLRAQDADSPRDVASVELLIGISPEDPAPCWMRFTRALGIVELRSEDNSRWIQPAPSDLQIGHNRCSVPARALLQTQGSAAFITLGAAFRPGFNGAKGLWVRAVDASGVSSGWRRVGDHAVNVVASNRPPTLTSPLPASIRGRSSTLAVSAADPDGTFDIRNLAISLVPDGSSQEICRIVHDSLSRIQMVASSEEQDWVVFPNGHAVETGLCSALSWFFQFSGTTPYVWQSGIALRPASPGVFLVRGRASDMAGVASEWIFMTRWEVNHPNRPPSGVRVTASPGTGKEGTLEISAQDPDNPYDVASLTVTISPTGSLFNSCSFTIQPPIRRASLAVDDLSLSYASTIGMNIQLENGQCLLPLRTAEFRWEDGAFHARMPVRFLAGLTGQNIISVSASDLLGGILAVANAGNWTVPAPNPNRPPEVVSLQKQASGGFLGLTASFTDQDGYGHLAFLDVRIGEESQSCAIRYDRTTHTVRISTDDGTGWQSAIAASSSTTVSNAYCSFVPQQMRFTGSGQNLTWSLNVSLRAPLTTGSSSWMAATDREGASTGWVRR